MTDVERMSQQHLRILEAIIARGVKKPELRRLAVERWGEDRVREIEERAPEELAAIEGPSPEEMAELSKELEADFEFEAMIAGGILSPEEIEATIRPQALPGEQ